MTKKTMNLDTFKEVIKLRSDGLSVAEIERSVGFKRTAIYEAMAKFNNNGFDSFEGVQKKSVADQFLQSGWV